MSEVAIQIRDWDVSAFHVDGQGRWVVTATPHTEAEALCPACGCGDLARKGENVGQIHHRPVAGRAVVIESHRARWQCADCGHGFSTPAKSTVAGSRFTCDAYDYALEQSAVVPVEVLAETMGTPVSTLRRLVGHDVAPPADGFDGHASELAICPLCVRRFDRSMAVERSVPLGALPGTFRSRLPICPTCDEEGAPISLRG